jgi:hypothetical protein
MHSKLCLALLSSVLLAACQSSSTRDELVKQQSGSMADPDVKLTEKPAAPQSGGDIRTIQVGMTEAEVREILSSPDNEDVGLSGRAFNPFYFGPNQTRATWTYKGKGRVIFDRNMYTGTLRVVRVVPNPKQP